MTEQKIDCSQLIHAPQPRHALVSPAGLNVDISKASKVHLKLLNHSPETDGMLVWRTTEAPDQDAGGLRFTMKSWDPSWQDITLHIDGARQGEINQIRLIVPWQFIRCLFLNCNDKELHRRM